MRPIRLAVIFDQQICSGGGYQQALNAALLTRELPKDLADVFYFTTLNENVETLLSYGIQADFIRLSFFARARCYIRNRILNPYIFRALQKLEPYTPLERHLVEHEIDLVYFLSPSEWTLSLEKLNYISTIWDLCHRDNPEFPEVRWGRQFEIREHIYQAIIPRATAIFVDSKSGKMNILRRYGCDEERIKIMPFEAALETRKNVSANSSEVLNILEKYKLDVPYVFYPAQFWAHKNHIYLLEGLRILEQCHNMRIGAIFSGGDQGNRAHVEEYVREVGLEDRVRFAGFVPNEDMSELYRQSLALVMPSYFGPTNLPPLEAFELGVPVLYSDKPGMRDQVGDAALLMDLTDPGSMAGHLKSLIEDDQLKNRMTQAGKIHLQTLASTDRIGTLYSVIEEFRWRRACWRR